MADVLAVQTSLTLNDQLIAGLRRVAAQLRLIDADVRRLQTSLNALRVNPGLIGQFNAMRTAMGAATMSARQANSALGTMRVSPVASSTAQTLSRNLQTATTRARALSRAMATMPAAGAGSGGGGAPPGATTSAGARGGRGWVNRLSPMANWTSPGGGGAAPPSASPGGGRGRGSGGVHQIFEGVGLGYLAAGVFKGTHSLLKPAMDYEHQVNIMRNAGFSQKEMADAASASWKNTSEVITSSVTGNIRDITDMRQILSGGTQEAIKFLPIMTKVAAAMSSSSEESIKGNAGHIALNISKAMDIMGLNTPAEMEHGAKMLSKVVSAFQNRIDPAAFASTSFYMRQARYDHADSFRYGVIPAMMLERAGGGGGSGGSRGIGPQIGAIHSAINGIVRSKQTSAWFSSLGLLRGNGPINDSREYNKDPFLATWRHLVPAMERKHGFKTEIGEGGQITNAALIREHLAASKMTRNAMSTFQEFVTKAPNFLRDMSNVGVLPEIKTLPPLLRRVADKMGLKDGQGAMDYEQVYKSAFANDPGFWEHALSNQWQNLRAAMAVTLVPGILGAMQTVTEGMNSASMWARKHPRAAGTITSGIVGTAGLLSAGLAIQGVVFALRGLAAIPGVAALGSVLGGAGGGILALSAALAVLTSRIGETREETKKWMKSFLPKPVVEYLDKKASASVDRMLGLDGGDPKKRYKGYGLAGEAGEYGVGQSMGATGEYGVGQVPGLTGFKPPGTEFAIPFSPIGSKIQASGEAEGAVGVKTETIERVANVSLTGESTFNGSIHVDMGSLGSIIQQAFLKGVISGSGGAAGSSSHSSAHWSQQISKPPST